MQPKKIFCHHCLKDTQRLVVVFECNHRYCLSCALAQFSSDLSFALCKRCDLQKKIVIALPELKGYEKIVKEFKGN